MSADDSALVDLAIAARRVAEFISGLNWDGFEGDLKTQSAVQHQLIVMGEATKRLSVEFRNANAAVAWTEIAGLRDILTHAYHRVSLKRVWDIASSDVPLLLSYVEPLLPPERH